MCFGQLKSDDGLLLRNKRGICRQCLARASISWQVLRARRRSWILDRNSHNSGLQPESLCLSIAENLSMLEVVAWQGQSSARSLVLMGPMSHHSRSLPSSTLSQALLLRFLLMSFNLLMKDLHSLPVLEARYCWWRLLRIYKASTLLSWATLLRIASCHRSDIAQATLITAHDCWGFQPTMQRASRSSTELLWLFSLKLEMSMFWCVRLGWQLSGRDWWQSAESQTGRLI